jgi:ABC-type antimicrobial peptide transport system permease subunit
MKIRDLGELAARNLREALLRNSLTTLGIAVGVASLVAMLSLGVGLQDLANQRLSHSGLFDAIFISPRTNFSAFGRPARTNEETSSSGAIEPPRALDEDARAAIEHLPNVIEVYPEIRFPTEVQFKGNPYSTVVAGVPMSARSGGAFDAIKGAFFSGPAADETILQIDFARELSAQPDTLLGQEIVLSYAERQPLPSEPAKSGAGGRGAADAGMSPGFSVVPREENLRIVGIVETQPAAGFGGATGRLLIPLQLAEKLRAAQTNDFREILGGTPGKANYQSLTVRVSGPSAVKDVEDAIKGMGYSTFSLLDATDNLRLVFAVFDLLLGIFGSLALVVASLGIINTLVMAILERRREIGVLKALGAADRDIRRLFFVEAGVMGLLGGICGVALGWAIGRAMNFGANVYLHRRSLPATNLSSVPWWLVAAAIAFSVGVSLAAGIYPASRAAQLDPVEALRYE